MRSVKLSEILSGKIDFTHFVMEDGTRIPKDIGWESFKAHYEKPKPPVKTKLAAVLDLIFNRQPD